MGDRGEVRALVKETNISVYGSSKLGNQKEPRGFKVRLWGRETFLRGHMGRECRQLGTKWSWLKDDLIQKEGKSDQVFKKAEGQGVPLQPLEEGEWLKELRAQQKGARVSVICSLLLVTAAEKQGEGVAGLHLSLSPSLLLLVPRNLTLRASTM